MKMCVAIITILVLSLHTLTCGFIFHQMQPSYSRHRNREFLNADILMSSATLKPMEENKNKPNLGNSSIKILSDLDSCKTGFTAKKVLDAALAADSSNPNLYTSLLIPRDASSLSISDAELAIATNIRNSKYSIMDLIELNGDKDIDRAASILLCVFVGSIFSATVAQQSLPGPEIVRFIAVWLLSASPLVFVGFGIATPERLQTILVQIQRFVFPSYRKRMLQHEAGHFLMGHLLGIPIRKYQSNAVKNAVEFYPLSDADVGQDRASKLGFDTKRKNGNMLRNILEPPSNVGAFFDEGGSGESMIQQQSVFRNAKNYTDNPFLKLPAKDEPKTAWPYRGFDSETLDKLAVISVAGVCAEILAFGNAEGGYADFSQLNQFFASSSSELSESERQNRIRFSLGYAMGNLKRHLGCMDALVEAMEKDSSVKDCIIAIETCDNISGATVMGSYEQLRRKKIQSDDINFLESFFLMRAKNADEEDYGIIEGKGGGERKAKFQLSGDDPLYAAIGAAGFFFVWASSGGLQLH